MVVWEDEQKHFVVVMVAVFSLFKVLPVETFFSGWCFEGLWRLVGGAHWFPCWLTLGSCDTGEAQGKRPGWLC